MEVLGYILLGGLVLAMLFSLGWRLTSRRQSLPCPVWLRWMVEVDNPFTRTNRAAVIIEHLGIQSGMTVLDAGCGPGRLIIPLANRVGEQGKVVAMDIQSGMLERVAKKARTTDIQNITYLQAGLGEGKLGISQFDRALLVTVLGEIPDHRSALKEVFDALKPGGLLSVTEVIFDPHFQRRSTVGNLTEAVGFRVKTVHGNCVAYTMILEKVEDSQES